ncbi:hypothetical protein AC579_5210 [Pseudocercospora musae]|uniref:Uncharacterized protein n=1 Tax=Pseudocercospora musae TaxID=113226 RepID=A0A139ID84_9PEZI|nr:hypothetical protein AC579_5210 [Pseudocercospora musae]
MRGDRAEVRSAANMGDGCSEMLLAHDKTTAIPAQFLAFALPTPPSPEPSRLAASDLHSLQQSILPHSIPNPILSSTYRATGDISSTATLSDIDD